MIPIFPEIMRAELYILLILSLVQHPADINQRLHVIPLPKDLYRLLILLAVQEQLRRCLPIPGGLNGPLRLLLK